MPSWASRLLGRRSRRGSWWGHAVRDRPRSFSASRTAPARMNAMFSEMTNMSEMISTCEKIFWMDRRRGHEKKNSLMQKKMSDMLVISEKSVTMRLGGVRDAVMDVGQAAGISDTASPTSGQGKAVAARAAAAAPPSSASPEAAYVSPCPAQARVHDPADDATTVSPRPARPTSPSGRAIKISKGLKSKTECAPLR